MARTTCTDRAALPKGTVQPPGRVGAAAQRQCPTAPPRRLVFAKELSVGSEVLKATPALSGLSCDRHASVLAGKFLLILGGFGDQWYSFAVCTGCLHWLRLDDGPYAPKPRRGMTAVAFASPEGRPNAFPFACPWCDAAGPGADAGADADTPDAATLPPVEIVIFGGWDSQCNFGDMHHLTLAGTAREQHSWSPVSQHGPCWPDFRSCHAAVRLDADHMVMQGGAHCRGGPYHFRPELLLYNVPRREWSVLPCTGECPARAQHTMHHFEGMLYIAGGMLQHSERDERLRDIMCVPLARSEVSGEYRAGAWRAVRAPCPFWSPDVAPENHWTASRDFIFPKAQRPCLRRGELLYFYGGSDLQGEKGALSLRTSNTVAVFNLRTEEWGRVDRHSASAKVGIGALHMRGGGVWLVEPRGRTSDAKAPPFRIWRDKANRVLGPEAFNGRNFQMFPPGQRLRVLGLLFANRQAGGRMGLCSDTLCIVAGFLMHPFPIDYTHSAAPKRRRIHTTAVAARGAASR